MTFEDWYKKNENRALYHLVRYPTMKDIKPNLEEAYKAGFQEGVLNGTMKDYEV